MKTNVPQLIAGLALLGTVACTAPAPPPAAAQPEVKPAPVAISPAADANIAVVQAYLDGLVKADAAAIHAATNADFMSYTTWMPADSANVDSVIAGWQYRATKDTDQKLDKTAALSVSVAPGQQFAGDWVYYWGTYSATDKSLNKPYKVPFFCTALMANGKISKDWTYYDRLAIFHQLGVAPPAPKTASAMKNAPAPKAAPTKKDAPIKKEVPTVKNAPNMKKGK